MKEKHRNTDGTYDGIGMLSDLSGLSRTNMHEIWEQVKANQKLLSECVGPHDFQVMPGTPEGKISKKYRCLKCGGEEDSIHVSWYKKGLEHGRVNR